MYGHQGGGDNGFCPRISRFAGVRSAVELHPHIPHKTYRLKKCKRPPNRLDSMVLIACNFTTDGLLLQSCLFIQKVLVWCCSRSDVRWTQPGHYIGLQN